MAVVLKENGKLIGQCGLTMQSISENDDVIEIGYILIKIIGIMDMLQNLLYIVRNMLLMCLIVIKFIQ